MSSNISRQRPPETAQHFALLIRRIINLAILLLGKKTLTKTYGGLRNNFKERAGCDFDKPSEVSTRHARTSLGDVGGNRNGCPTHLVCQTKPFCVRERTREGVYQVSEVDRTLPDVEFFKVEHSSG